jgi:hypothetical protein
MNHLHLQETARHYANLAEQYRTELTEEQQLNEDLLDLVDALCEELGIDVEALFEDVQTNAREKEMLGKINSTTDAYHAEKPGAERRLQNLLKQDALERGSPHLIGKGGHRRGRGTARTRSRRSR